MIKKSIHIVLNSWHCILASLAILMIIPSCSNQNDISQQYVITNLEDRPTVPLLVYTTTAEANEDIAALNKALAKASRTCNALKMRAEIMSSEYSRIGYSKQQLKLITDANSTFNTYYPTESMSDYIALLRFKCIPYEQPQLISEANRLVGKQF